MTKLPPSAEAKLVEANAELVDDVRDLLSVYFNQRQSMDIDGGVATVHAYGPMLSDGSPLDLGMGATGYEEIIADIEAANATEGVKAIILKTNTPGGTVSGIEEAYKTIKESNVPVFGYNEGYATSAGYYLLAATEYIAASASSTTGNIGTVLDYWDFSGVYEAMGAERITIVNEGADLKGTHRDSPMTEPQRQFLTDDINAMGEQFFNRVEENRPDIDPEVKRAGWYQPTQAAALGLIDAESTFPDFTAWVKSQVDIGE